MSEVIPGDEDRGGDGAIEPGDRKSTTPDVKRKGVEPMDDRIEGKLKEGEGKLTGDKGTEAEGKAQGGLGKAKDAAGDAADAAKDKVDDLKD